MPRNFAFFLKEISHNCTTGKALPFQEADHV